MSLSSAFKIATSALLARQTEISVTSRNIAGANQPGFSRKTALLSTLVMGKETGGVRVDGISRAQDAALFGDLSAAKSADAAAKVLIEKLDALRNAIGGPHDEMSPAARLGDLFSALQAQSARPGDVNSARDTLEKAKMLVRSLNQASAAADAQRTEADSQMATSVERINDLLRRFGDLNKQVVQGTIAGADVSDALDARDKVLMDLSAEIGVRALKRENNDLVLFTDGGAMLFETEPRTVTMVRTHAFGASTEGAAVHVDGIPVTGPTARQPLVGGRLAGLAEIRDRAAPGFQAQLDEIARALVETFRETATGQTAQAGLFTWSGGPAVPAPGARSVGIAGSIRVNAAADPDQGGVIERIRDGGIAGTAYRQNTAGAASYSDRLRSLMDGFGASRAFDPAVASTPNTTLNAFAASTVSWLEAKRKAASATADQAAVSLSRTDQAYSNRTGVNLDEELQAMIEIEKSYGASAKLLGAVDRLYDDLLAVVR
ncbi:flagellar hook-associated protein FlgK [Chthonobacter rhizosphaerae]|uniref:flagellar hook-associated protein FlgK n=1 Tax=Chthonobacter rhizosphaerae TaxID=2735553 RepID=UPI0015EE8A04|nr:flagellar hook-associated protein FlgK [Chthonobacter rhizosphaerae]